MRIIFLDLDAYSQEFHQTFLFPKSQIVELVSKENIYSHSEACTKSG